MTVTERCRGADNRQPGDNNGEDGNGDDEDARQTVRRATRVGKSVLFHDTVSFLAMMVSVSELNIIAQAPEKTNADVLVIPVVTGDEGVHLACTCIKPKTVTELEKLIPALGVSGKLGALTRVPAPAGFAAESLAFVGTGTAEVGAAHLRDAFGAAVRGLTGVRSVALCCPASDPDSIYHAGLGGLLGAYAFEHYKVCPNPPETITVLTQGKLDKKEGAALADEATIVAEAINGTRDLVNTPPSDLNPVTFADFAVSLGKEIKGLNVTVWDEKKLEAEGFGGILGVGKGSVVPPRLVRVEYKPRKAKKTLALVGKGITFDSGGLSLKPANSMETMKSDMTGAATVLHTVAAAARLGLNVGVTAWLCLAENMPSGIATRPGDVLTMYSGRTVEVTNTDAEGRLVLGDGLTRACEENPDAVIDIATLTGAQIVALGTKISGVMGTDDIRNEIIEAADVAGEEMWPMPLPAQLKESLKSEVADTKNSGTRPGGMLVAGLFLSEYVGETPWAHIDIAGPSFNEGAPTGCTPKGGTGVAVATLLAWLTSHAEV